MAENNVNFNINFVCDLKALTSIEAKIQAVFEKCNISLNVFNNSTINMANHIGDVAGKMDDFSGKTKDADDQTKLLTGDIENATGKSNGFFSSFKKIGDFAVGFSGIINSIGAITGKMQEFTAANEAQQEAEAKLAQVMHNTMAASDAEIQSIKDLASAQQKLGVIGDEVQLAGAQELGTYLEKADSLKTLMPVMNDMLAQQYGLNATQEAAVNIGSMMGKVMEGQVGALSRYGYKFDEAQEKMLKFGTEEQRVATLAEVVSQSVGGTNAALAATPEGRLHQVSNDMGDIKERVGKLWADLSAKLVPAFDRLINIANGLIDVIGKGWPVWVAAAVAAVVAISKVSSSLTPVITKLGLTSTSALATGFSFKAMEALAKTACRGISTAIVSIPIVGWIAGAITLIVGLFTTLWNKCEGFRALVMGVWEVIKTAFQKYWEFVSTIFQSIWNTVTGLVKGITNAFRNAFSWIYSNVLKPLWNFFGGFADFVKGIIDKVVGWLASVFQPILDLWNKLTGKVTSTYQRGAQKGRNSYRSDQEKKDTKHGIEPIDTDFEEEETNNGKNQKNAANLAETVATGGTRNTQITINLGKMVESIVFNGSLQDNAQSLQQQVEEILLRTLYAAQTAAN